MAEEKKEEADDYAGAHLRPGGPLAFRQCPSQQNAACHKMPEARSVERGNSFHSVADGEVGGTPDHVNCQESQDDANPPGAAGCVGLEERGLCGDGLGCVAHTLSCNDLKMVYSFHRVLGAL